MTRLSFSPLEALLLTALSFLLSYGAAEARGAPKHDVLRINQSCPKSERLCLSAALIWMPDGWGRVTYREHGDKFGANRSITQDIIVRGRLNGDSPRVFLLRTESAFDDFSNPERDLGRVAFFGRSAAGRPIIMTDRGRIEILTKSVDLTAKAS